MTLYPVMLNLDGQSVAVVGGGVVAARKTESLLDCGAKVTVISPDLHPDLLELKAVEKILHRGRHYTSGDLDGMALAIAATNDREVNVQVNAEARARGIPVNVVDVPDLCSFYVPAVYRNGDLCIAVSSGGRAPMFSGTVRRYLESSGLGESLGKAVLEAAAARVTMDQDPPPTYDERVRRMGLVMERILKDIGPHKTL